MFKRVDRRLKRKAEQEELGIDRELKEALGIPDTDSDESDYDDESSDDEGGQVDDRDINAGDDNENDPAGLEEPLDDDLLSDEEKMEMSVHDVLQSPLYPSLSDSDATRCFVCPGKLLNNDPQIKAHLSSQHHKRRFAQFSQVSQSCEDEEANAREYLPKKSRVVDTAHGLSKREQKKLASRELHAKKRKDKKAAFQVRRAKRESSTKEDAVKSDKPKKAKSGSEPLPVDGDKKVGKKSKLDVLASKTAKSSAPPKKKRRVEKKDTA